MNKSWLILTNFCPSCHLCWQWRGFLIERKIFELSFLFLLTKTLVVMQCFSALVPSVFAMQSLLSRQANSCSSSRSLSLSLCPVSWVLSLRWTIECGSGMRKARELRWVNSRIRVNYISSKANTFTIFIHGLLNWE